METFNYRLNTGLQNWWKISYRSSATDALDSPVESDGRGKQAIKVLSTEIGSSDFVPKGRLSKAFNFELLLLKSDHSLSSSGELGSSVPAILFLKFCRAGLGWGRTRRAGPRYDFGPRLQNRNIVDLGTQPKFNTSSLSSKYNKI